MADDRHFVMGDFYRICDKSGFKVRARNTQMEWNGLIVSDKFYEARQPQDFVKGIPDNQTVPLSHPRQANVFIGPLSTTTTANAFAGATTLAVNSSVRMFAGDVLNIMLDTGITYRATISSVPNSTTLIVSPVLPYAVSSGNLITNLSAVAVANIG